MENPHWLPNIPACSFVTAYTTLLNYPFFNFSLDWKQNYQLIVCKIYFLPLSDICSDICTWPAADSTPLWFVKDSNSAISNVSFLRTLWSNLSGSEDRVCLSWAYFPFANIYFTISNLKMILFAKDDGSKGKGRGGGRGRGGRMNSRMLDSRQNMWSLGSNIQNRMRKRINTRTQKGNNMYIAN